MLLNVIDLEIYKRTSNAIPDVLYHNVTWYIVPDKIEFGTRYQRKSESAITLK